MPASLSSRERGFTLIELMVVVFIVALLAAGAVISLGGTGRDSQLERERDRLTALTSYVRERGAMLTLEYGLRCGQHGYRFVFFDNRVNQWQAETVDETLRPRKMPAGLRLQLTIEGHQIVLDDKALSVPRTGATTAPGGKVSTLGADQPGTFDNQTSDNMPQILLLSNGDVNSFSLTLIRDGANRTVNIQSDANGVIKAGEIIQPKS